MFRKTILFLFTLSAFSASAQEYLFPLNRDMETRIEYYLQSDSAAFHTALKPFTYPELRRCAPVDSVFTPIAADCRFNKTWLGRKLFKEHFVDVNSDDIHLSIDPVFNFQGGRDITAQQNTFVNTRGFLIQADVKQKFYFYSGFRENQARYVPYVNDFIHATNVAPGQGRVKYSSGNSYDFSMAYGGVGYTLNRHFDFLLANDKNFIGDGYRSLLLIDNAYNYPFLRINMTFWKFKYSVIYSVLQDSITYADSPGAFRKKLGRFSYLDLNIGKRNRFSIGIFESVISDRSFDFNYANPVVFLRPVEYSVGSPDNELLGANLKYKINSRNILYGQVMLDDFLLGEIKSGKGWWGNKQGLQAGGKSYNVFRVKNLNIQSEINYVRPYTYSHESIGTSYSHYNQALAHPLGANFVESVSFINYRWNNFFVEAKLMVAEIGKDQLLSNDSLTNYGNNIFAPYANHGSDYGHYSLDGIITKLMYKELRISYLLNPKTNFNIELGVTERTSTDYYRSVTSRFVYFGLRTSLENFYFDF